MRKPPVKWRQEWDALLGKDTDEAISQRLGVCEKSVNTHRQRRGIKPFSGKQRLPCSGCGRPLKRRFRVAAPTCQRCHRKAQARAQAEWCERNREYVRKYDREYLEANKARRKKQQQRWIAANRERWLGMKRKAWKRQHTEIKQLAVELDGLCSSCYVRHTEEDRHKILRRLLPRTVHEIREEWSCIWGPADEHSSAGEKRLYRDLRDLGAVRMGGTWVLQQRSAA